MTTSIKECINNQTLENLIKIEKVDLKNYKKDQKCKNMKKNKDKSK